MTCVTERDICHDLSRPRRDGNGRDVTHTVGVSRLSRPSRGLLMSRSVISGQPNEIGTIDFPDGDEPSILRSGDGTVERFPGRRHLLLGAIAVGRDVLSIEFGPHQIEPDGSHDGAVCERVKHPRRHPPATSSGSGVACRASASSRPSWPLVPLVSEVIGSPSSSSPMVTTFRVNGCSMPAGPPRRLRTQSCGFATSPDMLLVARSASTTSAASSFADVPRVPVSIALPK